MRNARSADDDSASPSTTTETVDIADIMVKNSRKVGTSAVIITDDNNTVEEAPKQVLVQKANNENPVNNSDISDDASFDVPTPEWLYLPLHEVVGDLRGFVDAISEERPIWNVIQVERFIKGWSGRNNVSLMDMHNLDLLPNNLFPRHEKL